MGVLIGEFATKYIDVIFESPGATWVSLGLLIAPDHIEAIAYEDRPNAR